MISDPSEYLYVTGDNIDDDHPFGDMERLRYFDGEVMPLRTGNTENFDAAGQPIPKKNIMRGEDICFLLEALLERASLSPYFNANASWYSTGSGASQKVWVTPAQAIFSRIIDSGFVAMLINAFRYIAGHNSGSSGGGHESSHGVIPGPQAGVDDEPDWEPTLGDEYAPVSGELYGYDSASQPSQRTAIIQTLWPAYEYYKRNVVHSSSYKCGPVDEPGWITPTLVRVVRNGVSQIILTRFAIEAMFENLKLMRIAYQNVSIGSYIYDSAARNSCVMRSYMSYSWKTTNPEGQEERDRGDATTGLEGSYYNVNLSCGYKPTHYQGNPNWYQTGYRWAIEGSVYNIKSISNLVLGMPRPLPTDASWRPIFVLFAHWRRRERASYHNQSGSLVTDVIEDTNVTKYFLYVGEARNPRSSDGRLVLTVADIQAAINYATRELSTPSLSNAVNDAKTPSAGNDEVIGNDSGAYASNKNIELSVSVLSLFVRIKLGDHTKWW